MASRTTTTGTALALLSAGTFGTSGAFASSLIDTGWTPGAAVTTRIVLAALVLTVPALLQLRGTGSRLRRGLGTLLTYGVFAVTTAQLCYFQAVQHLSVAVALLLEYSGTLLVVLWVWLRTKRRPGALTLGGGALSLVGLGLVLDLTGPQSVDLVGVLWGLGAAVGLAVYFVISSRTHEDALPPLVVAWGGLAVGGVLLLAAAAAGVLPVSAPRTDVVLGGAQVSWLVPVLGLALVAAVVAYVAGIAAARLLGPTVSSSVGLTEVLFAVLFAWLLVGQGLGALQVLGGLLVLGGIALVRLDERPAPAVTTPHEQVALAGV